jgi:hypothetical protein
MFQVGGAVMLGLIMWGLIEGLRGGQKREEKSSDHQTEELQK